MCIRVIQKIYGAEGKCPLQIGDVYLYALTLHLHNYYMKSCYDVLRRKTDAFKISQSREILQNVFFFVMYVFNL